MEPRDVAHLETIVNYCDEIDSAIEEFEIDFDAFSASSARRGVLAFFVEQIGEEARKLSKGFKDSHSGVDWPAVVNFRHHIAHAYVGVFPDVLWDTVQNDIPELRDYCKKVLAELGKK